MKNYAKRVWVHKDISIYRLVEDSVITGYRVVRKRKTAGEFKTQSEAYFHAKALEQNSEAKHSDEYLTAQAVSFSPSEPFTQPLDTRFLAALEVMRLDNDGRHTQRQGVAGLIGSLASEAGHIPQRNHMAEEYVHKVFACITRPSNRGVNSKSAVKVRVQTFIRILNHVSENPTAFKPWLDTVSIVKARLKVLERGAAKSKTQEESFEPYSKVEIEEFLEKADFLSTCRLLVYLSGAFRAGEGDVFSHAYLVGDRVNLAKLVTKTKTKRMPRASLALQVLAAYLKDKVTAEIPEGVVKKRLRATAAVHLLLSNVPGLEVMERLGHANMSMLTNHYAKMTPAEWGPNYFGISALQVEGITIDINSWDKWLLYVLLKKAKKCDEAGIKEILLRLIDTRVDLNVAVNF